MSQQQFVLTLSSARIVRASSRAVSTFLFAKGGRTFSTPSNTSDTETGQFFMRVMFDTPGATAELATLQAGFGVICEAVRYGLRKSVITPHINASC